MSRLVPIILSAAVTLPALALRFGGVHAAAGTEAALFGVAILGAAFLLTWAAEVAQLDISQGLALAALALIAVLPEYAVDLYFAWKAPHHHEYTAYATANMTGANRLLIGIAWPLIVVLFWWRGHGRELELPRSRSIELVFLTIATVYSFVIPLKGTISLLDMVVLVGCFVGYVWRIAQGEVEEPELLGPAAALALLPPVARRTAIGLLFVFSAVVIFGSAERFAEALVHIGTQSGIDEFLLVQWLAPLASEAPEVAIACILTFRGDAQAGMGAMVSSKVNQWTLLVGTLPLVYSISAGAPSALHLDARQVEEILLTAAQSLFAVGVLANLRISLLEVAALFILFAAQLFYPDPYVRYGFCAAYLVLGVITMLRRARDLPVLFREGLYPSASAR
ncbi:MAG TPA: sodium:calcium antiporter [Candidatus Binatia bacterium]|nr:sodium:calcium antiporter [Candidatus Binatia bacterium]